MSWAGSHWVSDEDLAAHEAELDRAEEAEGLFYLAFVDAEGEVQLQAETESFDSLALALTPFARWYELCLAESGLEDARSLRIVRGFTAKTVVVNPIDLELAGERPSPEEPLQ